MLLDVVVLGRLRAECARFFVDAQSPGALEEAEAPRDVARIQVPRDADQAAIEAAVLADPKVKEQVGGKAIRKVIVVPGKLVNLVIG